MRILVTGGAGFIGSHLVEHYQNRGEVRVLDNLRSGFARNLDGLRCDFVNGSITDMGAVVQAMEGVDIVFHLAAMVSVPESMENPQECVELNVNGLLNVLKAAERAGVRKLVLASSAAVYGNDPCLPKVETLSPAPRSPYAVTKLDGEYYCEMWRQQGSLQTASLRFFNVFGPRQDPGSAYAAAVPVFVDRARRGEPICIFGDGEQTRDFVFVKDVAGAMAYAAETEQVAGVYNVGYGSSISINRLAQTIVELTHSESAIVHLPERAGDIRHSCASVEKLQSCGWRPTYGFDEGLRLTLA